MADSEHLELLRSGVKAWNAWREGEPNLRPDLRGASLRHLDLCAADLRRARFDAADLRGAVGQGAILSEAQLSGADLCGANFAGADFNGSDLVEAKLVEANLARANLHATKLILADLREADLSEAYLQDADIGRANLGTSKLIRANLFRANLHRVNLEKADMSDANLGETILRRANLRRATLLRADLHAADLRWADLREADLRAANLRTANFVEANLADANLTGSQVYGISAWAIRLSPHTKQQNLVITPAEESAVTTDNIEVAQFLYLLLHNEKIRDAIDTIGKKGVLLLGRFTEGRIAILERLREELRKRDFLPMVFNFEKPETKDFTETVRLLAGLSRFVIADITKPRSSPMELQAVVPDCMVPFVPIIEQGEEPFAMFKDLWVKHGLWVLNPMSYRSVEDLIEGLDDGIVNPALARFDELLKRKAAQMPVTPISAIAARTSHQPPS